MERIKIMRRDIKFTNPIEIQKRKQLQSLFADWKKHISGKPNIVFKDDGKDVIFQIIQILFGVFQVRYPNPMFQFMFYLKFQKLKSRNF